MPVSSWSVTHIRTDEIVVPGKRLGRNYRFDSRSLAYPWKRSDRALTSQLWPRHIPILDQVDVGSCTAEEETGALGTGPVWDALTAAQRATLTQALALKIYSAAETIDGDGPYPPQDNGSSGPSAAQAAKAMGLISGYLHCLTLEDVLDALEDGAIGIGSNWYTSMDDPDSSGLVTIAKGATVRGGHEYLCRGKDVDKQLVFLDNSWGTSFGVAGSFSYSYATLERLLSEQGDGTASLPLSVPAPAPVPVPAPTPGPPGPDIDPADQALALATRHWVIERHTGDNKAAARAVQAWRSAKGF